MKAARFTAGLVALAVVGTAWGQAVIEGTVALPRLRGPVPLPHYPNQVVQPGPPELPTAVVYLEGPLAPPPATNPTPVAVMSQRRLQFEPALLPIRAGTRVEFPNHDDLYHNVFSYSKPRRFDLGRYRKDERPAAQVFDTPGVVRLNCEIHQHMRGIILVLDTPHFTRTDTNGHFRLAGLPPGEFTLKAWLDDRTVRERRVTLTAGGTLRADFPAR
jgi:plastocyanin